MSDRIFLEFSNDGQVWKKIGHFLSYTVDADLYVADHAWSLELANPETAITPAAQCRLHVNDQLELVGIVDGRYRRCDKQGRKQVVYGRDLMGILVDAYCEDFVTVAGTTLGQLAEYLIGPNPATGRPALPFINRRLVTGQTGLAGKLDSKRQRGGLSFQAMFDTPAPLRQITPGQTVFQVLQTYALSSGVMFYGLPDGRFVFDRPVTSGAIDYHIVFTDQPNQTNALSAEIEQNIAKSYSRVVVVGQRQGQDIDSLDATRTQVKSRPISDPDFPFYKPFVQCSSHDSQTPEQHARLILERMRNEAQRLTYEMPRHSQGGQNFTVNRLARLQDDVHNIHGTYLVTGRTYRLDKQDGPVTTLRLSPPGIVEDLPMKGGRR